MKIENLNFKNLKEKNIFIKSGNLFYFPFKMFAQVTDIEED